MNPEITLLVHNIRSTHNVGAILRTAEGFGVKKDYSQWLHAVSRIEFM